MTIQVQEELDGMREVGRVVARALEALERRVRPGVTTAELDAHAAALLAAEGARSAPALVYGFPGTACISVGDEVVHGVPGERRLEPGDVVKLDVTAEKGGFMADAARTVVVPPVSREKRRLLGCARAAFHRALEAARVGHRVWDVGRAVEREVRRRGFRVVEDLAGHGIGRTIHEPPSVPNVFDLGSGERLERGLVLAIEPMVTSGSGATVPADDGWTIRTADGAVAVHFEQTVVVGLGRPLILTAA